MWLFFPSYYLSFSDLLMQVWVFVLQLFWSVMFCNTVCTVVLWCPWLHCAHCFKAEVIKHSGHAPGSSSSCGVVKVAAAATLSLSLFLSLSLSLTRAPFSAPHCSLSSFASAQITMRVREAATLKKKKKKVPVPSKREYSTFLSAPVPIEYRYTEQA